MTLSCTAPRQGHRPGSAAERACPVHGRQASRRASVAVAAPVSSDKPTVVERYDDGSIKFEEWRVGDELHRINGPAVVRYHSDGTVKREEWFVDGELHRTDGPARVWYHQDGTVEWEDWWVGGERHRTDGPAIVRHHPDGTVESETWFVGGRPHRTNGPAHVRYRPDGSVESEEWRVDGVSHRIDGPAAVWYRPDGSVESEEWYVDSREVDGPASVLGRYLMTRGVSGLSAEALKQIVRDVPWQRWSELGPDHPLVALWGTVHPSAEISAD